MKLNWNFLGGGVQNKSLPGGGGGGGGTWIIYFPELYNAKL